MRLWEIETEDKTNNSRDIMDRYTISATNFFEAIKKVDKLKIPDEQVMNIKCTGSIDA